MARQRAMNIDVQQALGLGSGKGRLGILDIGDQSQATLVIGFAVERRADARRAAPRAASARR
jgi:hypothetical protein